MAEPKTAKLFQNGGSQAVRLPAEFRFEGDEVYITRNAVTGDVTLSSRPGHNVLKDFIEFRDAHPISDEDWEVFDAAIREMRESSVPADDRRLLDLFREDE